MTMLWIVAAIAVACILLMELGKDRDANRAQATPKAPMTNRQKAAAVVVVIATSLVVMGYATWDQWAPFALQALGAFQ